MQVSQLNEHFLQYPMLLSVLNLKNVPYTHEQLPSLLFLAVIEQLRQIFDELQLMHPSLHL
jgi:hypothetical protein